jgi:ribosomal protein S18 acetylase RimI-like enzyme
VADQLQPAGRDLETCRRFLLDVASLRLARTGVPQERRGAILDAWLANAQQKARLWLADGRPMGLVQWSSGNPVGPTLELVMMEPSQASVDGYRRLLSCVRRELGDPAFLYGPIPGLTAEEERQLLTGGGFRPFSRSEMTLPRGARLPPLSPPSGCSFRRLVPEDRGALAALHHRTYDRRFDGYLFLELEDRAEDSRREVRQILEGRWGAFVPEGSGLAERDGRLVGAVLGVRGAEGVLIAQVMVDPSEQGRGLGRALLAEVLRALLERGTHPIYLNVTEGNRRAVRLYEGLGFVRSLGPSQDWYNTARIPVSPDDGDPTAPR